MPVLNPGLSTIDDFKAGKGRFEWSMRQTDINAFLGRPRVEVLRGGVRLYKLTQDGAAQDPRYGVTPWWSSVNPWMEDYEGAKGRYDQAVLNGIDMSSMVRYMSAVRTGWNALTDYVEVKTHPLWEIHCFWGRFQSQNLIGTEQDIARAAEYARASSAGFSDAILPQQIGTLESWQFYIPGLKDEHLAEGAGRKRIDAHDMKALGEFFGVQPAPLAARAPERMPPPAEFFRATHFSGYQDRNKELQEMDKCLSELHKLYPTLAPNIKSPQHTKLLERFCDAGRRYMGKSTDPSMVKSKVNDYIRIADALTKRTRA